MSSLWIHSFDTSLSFKITLPLVHFEPVQMVASVCKTFCTCQALHLALAISKANLRDLQFPSAKLDWAVLFSLPYPVQYLFCCFFFSSLISSLSHLLQLTFLFLILLLFFLFFFHPVLVSADSMLASSTILLGLCPHLTFLCMNKYQCPRFKNFLRSAFLCLPACCLLIASWTSCLIPFYSSTLLLLSTCSLSFTFFLCLH